jgi:chromosome partitioning protein
MPVIAVINRKGGSGKSTLATHLAAWCAHQGMAVMLGDVDRQRSTQVWLKLREAQAVQAPGSLVGWAVDPKNVLRPPAGVRHVVLDTPGGLRGFDLARVVMFADAVLMPVGNAVFDRRSAADCVAELRTLPRVAGGRCKLAAVGMRVDGRTRGAATLADWAARLELPLLGVLRDTQAYVKCTERGLTLFDLPAREAATDLAQWQPILEWLEPVLRPAAPAAAAEAQAGDSLKMPLVSGNTTTLPGMLDRLPRQRVAPPAPASLPAAPVLRRPGRGLTGWLDWLSVGSLLRR